ncbi:tRNA (cytidine(34)-2'-O)-methyltransferase [Methanimicrococcus sp. At1]|uniref:tRNA (Cytidine(34)-2'-O)-methyltransferase n=1 Tax=Methanimicrococcus hacksteinii TaxID=3028293 RepID=A0ABU3VNM0_9EURY|nr:RNA methyltransferase [Methanimicrococcus sp. At1]MDV0444956.1 tRNA (cytidine(34)-2'-O)-methyltransferase [Methanimicrococcus sp. At1]
MSDEPAERNKTAENATEAEGRKTKGMKAERMKAEGMKAEGTKAERRKMEESDRFLPNLRIILVEPLYQGNVGSVCRVMKNFGFTELYLVNPCPLEGEARAMSSHAIDVLQNAKICLTIEEAVAGYDVVIGTTGMRAQKGCDHIRTPAMAPGVLREKMEEFHPETKFALLFGREDIGFTNDELAYCSMIATVPSSHIYPVMNLSHAVGIMVYELSGARLTGKYKTTDFKEFNAMCAHFEDVLKDMEFDPFKQEKMALMMKRIFARAELTPCEAKTLRGIFRNIQYHAKKAKGEDVSKYRQAIENQFENENDEFDDEFNLDFDVDFVDKMTEK